MANIMVTLQKLANENTKKTFEYNAKEASESRDWQKMMSDTSHQREVQDLVAAGLNPVLSSGGSGAQSYTTTAASGIADSAVNAIGNVQSARTAAAATRYAAAQQASAMRYAAAMQYESTKFATENARAGNIAGLIDKFATKGGIWSAVKDKMKAVSNTLEGATKYDLFKNAGEAKRSNYKLSIYGRNKVTWSLARLGVRNTKENQKLFIDAFYWNDKSAQNRFGQILRNPHSNKGYFY